MNQFERKFKYQFDNFKIFIYIEIFENGIKRNLSIWKFFYVKLKINIYLLFRCNIDEKLKTCLKTLLKLYIGILFFYTRIPV